MKQFRVLALFLLGLAAITSPWWVLHLLWQRQPMRAARVTLVDYSVPYTSGREHRGAQWVLNHEKYVPPAGRRWTTLGSHVGYHPDDRDRPTTLEGTDLRRTDWIYLTDAYGVYEDDLKEIALQRAHMDYSTKVFGGLSLGDAQAIAAHSARGKHTFLEFNALEEPTSPEARTLLQDLFGVEWTGWTGRFFLDLRDTTDVPHWLPRQHRALTGLDSLPEGAALALIHRDGRLVLITGFLPREIAPHVELTPLGSRVLPAARGGARYFYWFPVLQVRDGTERLADLVMPSAPAIDSTLAANGIPARLPLLTRRTDGGAHRLYLAGDFADTDFDPGVYAFKWLGWIRARAEDNPVRYDGVNAFWQFYVPAVRTLLRAPFAPPASP